MVSIDTALDPALDSALDSGALAPAASNRAQKLYFAVWRWHFYAALYAIPFFVMLALSGMTILWFTAIAPEYGDRLAVTPAGQALRLTELEAAALAAHPGGTVDKYIAPYDTTTPALLRVQTAAGAQMLALDPYTGVVLRDRPEAGTWNKWATSLHGQLLTGVDGGIGDYLVETAASLGILLVVTGFWLAWPRNGEGFAAMVLPRFSASGRAFWKSLHRAAGTWIGIVLAFFLISGLAWAGIWGGKFVQAWSQFPAEKWGAPLSDKTHAAHNAVGAKEVPWALELTPLPLSGSQVGQQLLPMGTPVVFDTVLEGARALGFVGRVQIKAPQDATGVWTISQDSMSYDSDHPTADRTVHIDQYTGKVLADVRFSDYSLPGKAMAVGIALHEGQIGLLNIVLNFGFCLTVIFLCVGGLVMWWLRRPAKAGRLAAPPLPADLPMTGGVVFTLLLLSLAVPVLGLTLLGILALDLLVMKTAPALKRLLS
jgi:uncharacterized iron-regulated membrane protein